MAEMFFGVFRDLQLDKELKELLADAKVEKITKTSANDAYRFHIVSNRLIEKEYIYNIEEEIRKQVFKGADISVKLIERYELSGAYTPKKLLDVYFDSLLCEMKHKNALYYNLLRNSQYVFEDENTLVFKTDKTIVAEEFAHALSTAIKRIFLYRFGYEVEVDFDLQEIEEYKYRKEGEQKVALELAEISSRYHKGVQAEEGNAQEDYGTQHNDDMAKNTGSGGNVVASNDSKSAGNVSGKTSDGKMAAAVKKAGNPAENKTEYRREPRKADNPDVIWGRDFEDEVIPIEQIIGEIGEVVIWGQIRLMDERALRNGEKTIVSMDVTDFSDTITVKMFMRNDQLEEFKANVSVGKFVKVKGITANDRFDHEITITSVTGIKKSSDNREVRRDTSIKKRVELHCHTKMSDMDGVSDAGSIIKKAIEFGHKALAITDHGVVQGFTDALHAMDKIKDSYKKKGEKLDFKVIYGVEAYLVDDLKDVVEDAKGQPVMAESVVFDIETTGFSAENDRIIEIGAVKVAGGEIVDRFSMFINPEIPIPFRIEQLTGINDNMVMNAPVIDVVLPQFLEFCGDAVLVAHNAIFDTSFIKNKAKALGMEVNNTIVDTVSLSRILIPNLNKYTLDAVAKALSVSLLNHHRAVDDAEATAGIYLKLLELLENRGVHTLDEVNDISKLDEQAIKKLPTHHAIILATSDVGRSNLYRLVSHSHIKYFQRRPRIPKSDFLAHREGLLVGSACEAGELYQALLNGQSDTEIARLVNFYDYLEIQPLGNNRFMIDSEKIPVHSEEDLIALNKKIVTLGEKFNKPVVATCDVHFLNPEDEVYRRIIMAGKGFEDADNQAPLFLRTTEEMLEEFQYLGSDKAEEVVITNTNLIADMCEVISPVRPDKCPPVIENSDQMLRDICYNSAYELYGKDLPEIVKERLERELNSIISNGYSVMYIIAQKLVWKSNDDGYLVGSRGSVGSSFAATMAGITEVNPLSPHYLCKKCFYVDFDSDEVKAYGGNSGCDMPDKRCPKCGAKLSKEGFDIPFETFLGFKGNKEPDIDLNFSNEYQSKAHAYTEVIFGAGQTFKAGTIGTLAENTAYGYIKKYYEERDKHKRPCEINRLVEGCTGVRRTTGQHPGGIVVLPLGEEIDTFTPIQRPANDMTSNITTTHFDYHSIDHNLLKLDILGHLDPTMIRMLQDLTGVDPKDIPLDSREVMSLFQDTHALGITPEDISGCKLGALGIPEFGTQFAIQMLLDAKPTSFSDLVRIAGLAHGTDVWLGNAQTLIQEGKATISTAICTRDDIMIYLISKGLDKELSFTIMESVRKGKGLKEEWEEAMTAAGVPDWYIWSCKKIKYMFPKAHAAAYVMMAWRVAYCKIFYPLAYYTAYFSIRAKAFSYEVMCMGKDRLEYFLADFLKRDANKTLENKETDMLSDMRIVQEMYARGYEFMPIDLFRAQATRFQIIDGKIMPSLNAIEGVGENAAEAIVEAARDGEFLSKDDFRQRTKVSKTVIELLDSFGILGNLPETNQLSLFDL